MSRLAHSFVVLVGVMAAACGEAPWGEGGLGDELPAAAFDDEGLIFVLGDAELKAASAALTEVLEESWGEGVSLGGEIPVSAGHGEALTLRWATTLYDRGDVEIALDGEGLVVSVALRVESSELKVSGGRSPQCSPSMILDDAWLRLPIALGSDKLGRVQASLDGRASLTGELFEIDWSGCFGVSDASPLSAWTEALREGVAATAVEALGPELIAALPEALGLKIALGVATTVAGDEVGSGLARLSIEAREPAAGGVGTVAEGRLIVPFSVGIDVEGHPCVPAAELPPVLPMTQPDPAAVPPGATLISGNTIRRGLAALWLSGALCGDHATAGQPLPLQVLDAGWGPLLSLPATTPVSLHLWPRALPDVALGQVGGSGFVVSTGLMDVDLYVELDGASIRLFSLSLDADVTVTITASPAGLVKSHVIDVVLRAAGLRPGLVEAPSTQVAEAIVAPLVMALLDDRPLLRLPPRSGASESRARAIGSYLVIPR